MSMFLWFFYAFVVVCVAAFAIVVSIALTTQGGGRHD